MSHTRLPFFIQKGSERAGKERFTSKKEQSLLALKGGGRVGAGGRGPRRRLTQTQKPHVNPSLVQRAPAHLPPPQPGAAETL